MRCAYCDKRMDGRRKPTWDHIIPKFSGGTDARENLVRACQICNGDKANWLLGEWVALLKIKGDERAPIVEAFAEKFAPIAAAFAEQQRRAAIEAAIARRLTRRTALHPKTIDAMEAAKQRRQERAEKQERERLAAKERKLRRAEAAARRNAAHLLAGMSKPRKDVRVVPDYLISSFIEKGYAIDETGVAAAGAKLMRRQA